MPFIDLKKENRKYPYHYYDKDDDKLMSENLELKALLKDIENYKFNWICCCKNCNNIKMIILKYNKEKNNGN